MTVPAHMVEVHDSGETADLGAFAFAAPPAAGDQVVVRRADGPLAVFRVNFVEHDPVPLEAGPPQGHAPRLTAFVTLVGAVD